jgi:hypothetical protein
MTTATQTKGPPPPRKLWPKSFALFDRLGLSERPGGIYLSGSPFERASGDNYSSQGKPNAPLAAEDSFIRLHADIWNAIDMDRDVGPQVESGLRRMAAFLSSKADEFAAQLRTRKRRWSHR